MTTRRLRASVIFMIGLAAMSSAVMNCSSDDPSPGSSPSDAATDVVSTAHDGATGSNDAASDDAPASDGSLDSTTKGDAPAEASGDGAGDAGATDADASDAKIDAAGDAAADAKPVDAGCAAHKASNLLVNPGFETTVTPWFALEASITIAFDSNDAIGCASSGSVGVMNVNDAGINSGAAQCVLVTANANYDFGASVYLPASPNGQAFLQIDWNSATNCGGSLAGYQQLTADTSKKSQWQSLSGTAAAPAGAVAALVYLQIVQGVGSGYRPLFDRVYLSPSPDTF